MGSRLGTHGNGRRHAGRPVLSPHNHFDFPNHNLIQRFTAVESPRSPNNAKENDPKQPLNYETKH